MMGDATLIILKDHSGLEHGSIMRDMMWVLCKGRVNKVC